MEAKTRARALSVIAAGGIAGVALATGVVGGAGGLGDPEEAAASALEPFSSCDHLLEYAREHRWAQNPYPYATEGVGVLAAGAVAEDTAFRAAVPQADAVGPGETGTNVQEVGIDEPDVAKLSGSTLFRVQGKAIRAYDVAGDSAVLLDELELEGGAEPQLLIAGDKAIVIANDYAGGSPKTAVTEVDVSDPSAMSAIRTLELEGTHVSARLTGDIARLVIESRPEYPGLDGGPEPQPRTPDTEPPSGTTGETGIEPDQDDEPAWMPRATLFEIETGERSSVPLAGCGDVAFPDEFAGIGLLSVLTIDASKGIVPTDVDVVMTDGSTVYAGESGLYVATLEMIPPRGGVVDSIGRVLGPDRTTVPVPQSGNTQIHRFAATEDATEYAASGEVPGRLIGQFAMSEFEGFLRVASTDGDTWTEGPNQSESMVTVLAEDDGALTEVGQVGGLGRGEEIFAVRFIDDMGYVVTFEQTDPLYTVDLSDPENPQMTGELKIPGYSAYLHPVGDGRLLGIGQAGTADGTVTGAQASLFDVADPTRPERLDALDLADGRWSSTATEWDHHAFLYSPEHALAVIPVQSYGRSSSSSATAFGVGPTGDLTLVARLEDEGQIERTLVAGENLVTVSTKGVTVRGIDELG